MKKKSNITGDLIFGFFCLLVLGVIFYFVFASPFDTFTYIVVIAGIFSFLAFSISSYIMIKNRRYAGFSVACGMVSLLVTVMHFNFMFIKNNGLHNLTVGLMVMILMCVSVIKLWDSFGSENT
ncbi:hypothetical protein JXA85_01000 [Candidatus Woesearchaeota archaeon]|nr:hypothetical protein [Candidatus Woesearchaeota archaeon]